MKRLFIAIQPVFSNQTLEQFSAVKKILQNERIKWVDFNNLHLTLKFLGETEEKIIPDIVNVLNDTAKKHKAFQVYLTGLGVFKSIKNPRVFWVGFEQTNNLNVLRSLIECNLSVVGFKEDLRSFNPHITLGRIKNLADNKLLNKVISENRNKFFQLLKINKFYLIQSILRKTGPVYTVLDEFSLN